MKMKKKQQQKLKRNIVISLFLTMNYTRKTRTEKITQINARQSFIHAIKLNTTDIVGVSQLHLLN